MTRARCVDTRSSASSAIQRNAVPRPATAKAPSPADMPRPISRNRIVTSFGSSTGVRNLMILAAPAMPNARARELPMMIIIMAPDTQSSVCACSIERARSRAAGWWIAVMSRPIIAATIIFSSSMNGMNGWSGMTLVPFLALVSASSAASVRPVSSTGHFSPAQTSAPHRQVPAAAIRIVRHGHDAMRAASTESYDSNTPPRCDRSRTVLTADVAAASRRLPPTRCAVVWPRTSDRMPALSIDATPLKSTTR